MVFTGTKHNLQTFGVTPFIKLQNDTQQLNDEKLDGKLIYTKANKDGLYRAGRTVKS